MFSTIITVVHIVVALFLIVVVLFQQGKGASMGASFGGSSQTMFGPRGTVSVLAKLTTAVAIIFMLTSISLSVISNNQKAESVIGAPDASEPVTLPTTLPTDGPVGSSEPAEPVVPAEDTGGPVEAK